MRHSPGLGVLTVAESEHVATGVLRVIEAGLNRILALDPDTPQRIGPLEGHRIDVALSEPDLHFRLHIREGAARLAPIENDAEAADARVEATAAGLLALAASGGERGRGVRFEGDIAVVQSLRQFVAGLDIDFEEQLSRLTGDVIAHEVGRGVRGGHRWLRHAGATFLANLGEYLTEERGLIPPEAELAAFVDDVDRLRADADRLEARVRRLARRLDEGGRA